jgi:crossover junction endonuclease MUS81
MSAASVVRRHTAMAILLVIDIREKLLHTNIMQLLLAQQTTSPNVRVEVRSLDLGDIKLVLSKEDTVLRELVFERKTLSDMVSSMHDGRYREQKARLLANVPSHDTSYIVEGDTLCDSLQRVDKAVSSAYCNMVFRDDIHLFFTRNVSETALLLLSLCAKMLDKPATYTHNPANAGATHHKEYTSCLKLKTKKNHNITPENCFILQLAQVPSVSNVIAKNIAVVFPNAKSLVDAMRACASNPDKIKTLACIDKVGKAKAAKIVEYMHL